MLFDLILEVLSILEVNFNFDCLSLSYSYLKKLIKTEK